MIFQTRYFKILVQIDTVMGMIGEIKTYSPGFGFGVRGSLGEYFISDLKSIRNVFLLKRIFF